MISSVRMVRDRLEFRPEFCVDCSRCRGAMLRSNVIASYLRPPRNTGIPLEARQYQPEEKIR